jgi:ubiquinone/menaquinone biosynthesis C-methylase UbiE
MGCYADRVLPHILNRACDSNDLKPLRERVCAQLQGEVVEIGFGSGLNVSFYPQRVTMVAAVEPSDVAWRIAGPRVAASPIPIERSGIDAQSLPFPDDTFDSALSTWTMCTIPDAGAALHEIRRVLKPGGRLSFIEHGLAPDAKVQRWQRRFEPVQRRIAGGCHITRRIVEMISDAGFTLTDVDAFYGEHEPKILGAETLGTAVA